ncbi:hypothetical protein HanPI659440_Chr15g0595271 [Helianthus annuus]|nr:hypothetical protein HanPI659440_Chr15g0595271 [Helianthus annuus]
MQTQVNQRMIMSPSVVGLDMAPFPHIKPHGALKHHYGRCYGGFIIHPVICTAPDTMVALPHTYISIIEGII